MDVEKLLKDLVSIPSPSGEERKVGEFLVMLLSKNFKIKKQKVGNRFNILAYRGKPSIILSSHLDTVPKQLEMKEDKRFIYGRGSCDAKASVASMICASESLINRGFTNFGLLFDVSEETDFKGIKKAVNLVNPKVVIIGEPTNLKPAVGQKGLLGIKIKCCGKSAPGSTPKKGISAILKLISVLNKVSKIKQRKKGVLGSSSVNIGKIFGGDSANVVPDYAEAIIEFRTVNKNYDIIKKLRLLGINFEILYNFNPVLTKMRFKKKIVVPFFTEAYFWRKSKVLIFGPGEYKFAHSDNERIKKSDLWRAVKEYEGLIIKFLEELG